MDAIIDKDKKEKIEKKKFRLKSKAKRELFMFIANAKHLDEDQVSDIISTFIIRD